MDSQLVLGLAIFHQRCRFYGKFLGERPSPQWEWRNRLLSRSWSQVKRLQLHRRIVSHTFHISPLTGLEPALAVGSGIGGLVIGALAGIGAAYAFMQHRLRKKKRGHFINISSGSPAPGSPAAIFHQLDSNLHPRYSAVPSGHYHDSSVSSSNPLIDPATLLKQMTYDGSAHYEVEPFMFPTAAA